MRKMPLVDTETDALDHFSMTLDTSAEAMAAVGESVNWRPMQGSPAHGEAQEMADLGYDPNVLRSTWTTILDLVRASIEHAQSIAVLIRTRHLLTVPMIARQVLEHAHAACWILEPTTKSTGVEADRVSALQRAARGGLFAGGSTSSTGSLIC
jgi:hypothetical protein